MGILDRVVSKVNFVTYQKIRNMKRDGDVSGLVFSIDRTSELNIPYVLSSLRYFVEQGQGELILRMDAKERIKKRIRTINEPKVKRESLLLHISFMKMGFDDRVLDEDIARDIVTSLSGTDLELSRHILWAIPDLIQKGYRSIVDEHLDICILVSQLEESDPDLLYYTSYLISILAEGDLSNGIIRAGAIDELKRVKENPDPDVSNYAAHALRLLEEHRRSSSSVSGLECIEEKDGIQDPEPIRTERSFVEGYSRPKKGASRKKKEKTRLRSDGKRIMPKDFDDRTVELKKGESTISLKYVKGEIEEE